MAYIGIGPSIGFQKDYLFFATAGQSTFTGADFNGNILYLDTAATNIFVNGSRQIKGVDYNISDVTTLVFTNNLSENDEVVISTSESYQPVNTYTKHEVDNFVNGKTLPVGSLVEFPVNKIPFGFLRCNGAAFDAAMYPDLFNYLGSSTLPNITGKIVAIKGYDRFINEANVDLQEVVESVDEVYNVVNQLSDKVLPVGGTTNQILKKSSNDDFATEWSTPLPDHLLVPDVTAAASNLDFNTLTTAGWSQYLHQGTQPNGWGGSDWGFLLILKDSTRIKQFVIGRNDHVTRSRYYDGSTWSAWGVNGKETISSSAPTGGQHGDKWFQV